MSENEKISNLKKIKLVDEEIKKCIQCKACTNNCEMLNEYCDTPKELFLNIKEIKKVETIIPFSCNMCDRCEQVCPKDINLGEVFMEMRRDIVDSNNGASPLEGHKSIHAHQKLGFSKFFSLEANKSRTNINRVFLPGCSLSAYSPELVIKTYKYIKEKLPGTAIILQCCGQPTKSIGEEDIFNDRYKLLEQMLQNSGADEIITACQNCYKLISESSPEYKVKSLWTVIKDLGVPEFSKNIGADSDLVFSIHDACPTRYNTEIQESIRYIIDELGYEVEESEHSRENTSCCGMGGMVLPVNKDVFDKVSGAIAKNFKVEHIITYCASCREAMVRSGKKSLHILDLIFGEKRSTNSKFPGLPRNPIFNWINRLRTKSMAKREM